MLTILRNALIGLCVLGLASTALAQDDPEAGDISADALEGDSAADSDEVPEASGAAAARPISVGLLLGYGISFEDGPNPWGLGFGLRGGYNIDAIFLGARFVYYLGESEEAGGFEASINIWELGIEGGYDIPAGPVVIRPGLGLGIANASISADLPPPLESQDVSETNPYIALGASVLYDINPEFFIGGDGRIQIVIGDNGDGTALIILANGGMRF
jgi:hypothetical protein